MNRIRSVRKLRGLTLAELSERTGISANTLSRYENEKREPKLATWGKIASALNVSVAYLQGVSDKFEHFENNFDLLRAGYIDTSDRRPLVDLSREAYQLYWGTQKLSIADTKVIHVLLDRLYGHGPDIFPDISSEPLEPEDRDDY